MERMGNSLDQLVASRCDAFRGQSAIEGGLAFPESIDRGRLDYSIDSLFAIDRYLLCVHDHFDDIPVQAFCNTILAPAFYVGEVIRRNAFAMNYSWVTIRQSPRELDTTDRCWIGPCAVTVLSSPTGRMCMPGKVVARVIRRGTKAICVHRYAVSEVSTVPRRADISQIRQSLQTDLLELPVLPRG